MKPIISMAVIAAAATLLVSCNNDDNSAITEGTTGSIECILIME